MNSFAMLKKYDGININIGQLSGGTDPSLPIDELTVRGVCSVRSNITLDRLKELLLKNVSDAKITFVPLQIEPYRNTMFPKGCLFPSACDAPIFGRYNIPTIIWGPGSLEQAHTENEYIDLDEVRQYIIELHQYLYNHLGTHTT